MSLGVFAIALIGALMFFVTNGTKKTSPAGNILVFSNPTLGKYKHAAVASDVTLCSNIGR